MATQAMNIAEAFSEPKLDTTQVTVNEIDPEDSPVDIDRLTIQSPPPHVKSPYPVINEPTIIGYPPHEHGHPRPSSPTGSVRSSFTSRRRVSRHSHWSRRVSRSHRTEASKELTIEAEKEFFALMELMTSVSRRSVSLKEVWAKIISEREAHCVEMDRMCEQFEEFTEIIERHEKEKVSHHHDHEERKKEVLKLQLDLKIAIEASAEYKRKLADRDGELEKVRGEVAEFRDNYKYLKEEHEETKQTLEETHLKLVASEERCRHTEKEVEKHHGEIRSWKQKYTELETSRTELSTKFESTHKEMLSFKQAYSTLKKEKHDWVHEKGDLEEDLRKCRHREEELKRKVKEITESWEKKKHEVHELTEKVSKMKHEREELHKKIKILETKLEEAHDKCETADEACRKWKRKWDECEHDLITVREEFRLLEIEHTETKETITKKTEEIRRLTFEKEQLEEDHHAKCTEATESHRQLLVLQESLRRTESTVKQKSETIHTLTERVERFEREHTELCKARDDLRAELATSQSTLIELNLSLETSIAERDTARETLRECETRYESVCESMVEYQEGSGEWEEEITHLREMLREAREQKEKAIGLRKEADRERDESVSRYEAKCREVERLEERLASQSRSAGGRTVRRWQGSVYSRSVIGEEDEVRSVAGEAA